MHVLRHVLHSTSIWAKTKASSNRRNSVTSRQAVICNLLHENSVRSLTVSLGILSICLPPNNRFPRRSERGTATDATHDKKHFSSSDNFWLNSTQWRQCFCRNKSKSSQWKRKSKKTLYYSEQLLHYQSKRSEVWTEVDGDQSQGSSPGSFLFMLGQMWAWIYK